MLFIFNSTKIHSTLHQINKNHYLPTTHASSSKRTSSTHPARLAYFTPCPHKKNPHTRPNEFPASSELRKNVCFPTLVEKTRPQYPESRTAHPVTTPPAPQRQTRRLSLRPSLLLGATNAGPLDLGAGRADPGDGLRERERQRQAHAGRPRAGLPAHAHPTCRHGKSPTLLLPHLRAIVTHSSRLMADNPHLSHAHVPRYSTQFFANNLVCSLLSRANDFFLAEGKYAAAALGARGPINKAARS